MTGTEIAPPRVARPTLSDRWRLRELARRIDAGIPEPEAWASVATDPSFGFLRFRGRESVPEHQLHSALIRFLQRVAPLVVDEAAARVTHQLAESLPRITKRLVSIADGTDTGSAPKAFASVAATKVIYAAVGLGEKRGDTVVSVGVSVDASTGHKSRQERAREILEATRVPADVRDSDPPEDDPGGDRGELDLT